MSFDVTVEYYIQGLPGQPFRVPGSSIGHNNPALSHLQQGQVRQHELQPPNLQSEVKLFLMYIFFMFLSLKIKT